jgi:hypothetical protein
MEVQGLGRNGMEVQGLEFRVQGLWFHLQKLNTLMLELELQFHCVSAGVALARVGSRGSWVRGRGRWVRILDLISTAWKASTPDVIRMTMTGATRLVLFLVISRFIWLVLQQCCAVLYSVWSMSSRVFLQLRAILSYLVLPCSNTRCVLFWLFSMFSRREKEKVIGRGRASKDYHSAPLLSTSLLFCFFFPQNNLIPFNLLRSNSVSFNSVHLIQFTLA